MPPGLKMDNAPHIVTDEEKTLSQAAHDQGLILAYDAKEADLKSRVFKIDPYLSVVCEPELKEWYFTSDDAEDEEESEYEATNEDFQAYLFDLVFYRYTGKSVPDTVQQALKRIRGQSFWQPTFVWLKGHMYDTYNLPATDESGAITGIRL